MEEIIYGKGRLQRQMKSSDGRQGSVLWSPVRQKAARRAASTEASGPPAWSGGRAPWQMQTQL